MRLVVIHLTSSDNLVGVWVTSCEHSGVTTVENENLLVLLFGVVFMYLYNTNMICEM